MSKFFKNKKVVAAATVVVTTALTAVNALAAGETPVPTEPGALPAGVGDFFTKAALGLVATIGMIVVVALGVHMAPQAVVFAKKIFKKVSA